MLRRHRYHIILIAAVTAGCATPATTPPAPLREPKPAPAAAVEASGACAISAILVNSCHPWRDTDIRWVDAVDGEFPQLTGDGPYLLINWRVVPKWADVTQERIDEAAAAVRAIAPRKIFLALHAAPESGVTRADGCDSEPGAAGTPAEYRQLWKRVRARFAELSVANVVWVLAYANDPRWDCLVPELYPGDRYVDWIMFGGPDTARFQRLLMGMNGPDRQVLTKPLGVYGTAPATNSAQPNLRAYVISPG